MCVALGPNLLSQILHFLILPSRTEIFRIFSSLWILISSFSFSFSEILLVIGGWFFSGASRRFMVIFRWIFMIFWWYLWWFFVIALFWWMFVRTRISVLLFLSYWLSCFVLNRCFCFVLFLFGLADCFAVALRIDMDEYLCETCWLLLMFLDDLHRVSIFMMSVNLSFTCFFLSFFFCSVIDFFCCCIWNWCWTAFVKLADRCW